MKYINTKISNCDIIKLNNMQLGENSMGIYLDNGATSYPKPNQVAKAVFDFMVDVGVSSGRGGYRKAMVADKIVYDTRKLISKLFNQNDPKKVIFTLNVTEAINMALYGILEENDHVITSSLEHNAVWRCLKTMERDKGITISNASCDKDGTTKAEDVEALINKNTKLIIFTHASNVLGSIQPIAQIGEIAKRHNVLFLVDTAQTAGAFDIDMQRDNIDIIAFTGHKSLMGPMGTGGLAIRESVDFNPIKQGGTGGDSAYPYQVDYYPNKLEVGTLNISGIAGLKSALEYIDNEGIKTIHNKEKELRTYAYELLKKIEKVKLYGPDESKDSAMVISFNIEGMRCEDIAYKLDKNYDIMIRAGLHCAPLAHELIGTIKTGTARIGIGYFNTKEDIDKLYEALVEISNEA